MRAALRGYYCQHFWNFLGCELEGLSTVLQVSPRHKHTDAQFKVGWSVLEFLWDVSGALTASALSTHGLKASSSLRVSDRATSEGFSLLGVFFLHHCYPTSNQSVSPTHSQGKFLIIAKNGFLTFIEEVPGTLPRRLVQGSERQQLLGGSRISVVTVSDASPCFLPRSVQPTRELTD